MASLHFLEKNTEQTSRYLDRFHVTGEASARSLWLSIRNELEKENHATGNDSTIEGLAEKLANNFPDSEEYKQWLALKK